MFFFSGIESIVAVGRQILGRNRNERIEAGMVSISRYHQHKNRTAPHRSHRYDYITSVKGIRFKFVLVST
jgi:hypothetical protein